MKRKASVVRGLLSGAAAGLVGCAAMAAFQELMVRRTSQAKPGHGPHAPETGEENVTEKAVRSVAGRFGRSLTEQEKQTAGRATHYGFGTLLGMVYGTAAEYLPVVGVGLGTGFGTALFLGTDEMALPLLHLTPKPHDHPTPDRLLHWASHVVYAAATELTRRALVQLG